MKYGLTIAGLLIGLLTLIISFEVLERSKSDPLIQIKCLCARLIPTIVEGKKGVWTAVAVFRATNVGERPAIKAFSEWRHWNGDKKWLPILPDDGPHWLFGASCKEGVPLIKGRIPFITLPPGRSVDASVTSQTAANPLEKIMKHEAHLPFAIKITWHNHTGKEIPEEYYLDLAARESGASAHARPKPLCRAYKNPPKGIPPAEF